MRKQFKQDLQIVKKIKKCLPIDWHEFTIYNFFVSVRHLIYFFYFRRREG